MSKVSDAICGMVASLPGNFQRISGRPGFWFRAPNPPHLFSFIIVQHSAKHTAIGIDLVSSVFDSWDRQYGRHQLIKATGLQNVRLQSQSTPIEEESYQYGSDPLGTIELIRRHLMEYANPWFAAHAAEIANDSIVRCGIEATSVVPKPSLEDLKSTLRRQASTINANKWHRKETAILAIHLLAWANQERHLGSRSS